MPCTRHSPRASKLKHAIIVCSALFCFPIVQLSAATDPAEEDKQKKAALVYLINLQQSFDFAEYLRVGSAGGVLEYKNGLVLNVPPGALDHEVGIALQLLDCDTVDPILQAPPWSTLEKRCVAGIMGEPHGLQFAIPATLSIPASPLQVDELPIWTEIHPRQGSYEIPETTVALRGHEGFVDIQLEHFSTFAYMSGKSRQHLWADDLPPCCSKKPTPVDCCCIQYRTEQTAGDIQSGKQCQDCQIVGHVIRTKFPLCAGQPQAFDSMSEATIGCPDDLKPTIQPRQEAIWICQNLPLEARFVGTNNDGSTCDIPLPANWSLSASPDVSLTETGPATAVLRGLAPGRAVVEATSTIDQVTRARATINLETLSGRWLHKFPGWSEVCTMEGDSWVETSGPDQGVVILEHSCGVNSNSIRLKPAAFPSAAFYEGDLQETGKLQTPFSFSVDYASSNSLDCQVFMSSNGVDIVFGEEICPPGAKCIPQSCFESESASGTFSSATLKRSDITASKGNFRASWIEIYPDGNGGEQRVRRSISCDASSTATGEKL